MKETSVYNQGRIWINILFRQQLRFPLHSLVKAQTILEQTARTRVTLAISLFFKPSCSGVSYRIFLLFFFSLLHSMASEQKL